LHFTNIHGNIAINNYSVIRKVGLGIMIVVARLQESLRRDAPNIQTGTAKGSSHFYTGSFEPHLTSLDGCNITTRASAYEE
jgi:hypothetical protein